MSRKIFYNRNKNKQFLYFTLFSIFILLVYFFYYILFTSREYFQIDEFKGSFYFIPEDKKGQKIDNLDKKTLHMNIENKDKISLNNDFFLNYSIQFFVSDDYNSVYQKLLYYEKKKIINYEDLHILILNHELGNDYLLLYNNFESRELALDYCNKYLLFLYDCIILNAENID